MKPKLVVALNAALVVVAVAAAASAPRSDVVLVLTGPGSSSRAAAEVVSAAGGLFLGATGRASAIFARGDHPDFVDRLYASGALVVLEGGLWSGCLEQGGER